MPPRKIDLLVRKKTPITITQEVTNVLGEIEDPQEISKQDVDKKIETIQRQVEDNEDGIILDSEQQEALIDQLETRKFKLKSQFKVECSKEKKKELKKQYEETSRLLASVKECDAWDKVYKNKKKNEALNQELAKKFKKLAKDDFKKIIDLTAPKDERTPDISTELIWHKSKTVVFNGKTYREAAPEKRDKFQMKMKLKPMPKEFKEDMDRRMDSNCQALHIRSTKPDELKAKKYDPFNYNGLSKF